MVMVFVYTNLGPNPMWIIILTNTILWVGISSRMITSSALTSGVPEMQDRAAYTGGKLRHPSILRRHRLSLRVLSFISPPALLPCSIHDIVGYATISTMLITMVMMYFIDRQVSEKLRLARA